MSKPATWRVDPTHTTVGFAVRHLMISTVKGRFGDMEGLARFDLDNPTAGTLEVTIQAASIDTRTPDRDAHLRSPDFLEVERYPTITFRSRRIERTGGDQYRIIGDLTIRGVTHEVPLEATWLGTAKDPWGGERVGLTARGRLNRSDFGLTWNQALEAGGVLVGDEVRLELEVELVRESVQAAA